MITEHVHQTHPDIIKRLKRVDLLLAWRVARVRAATARAKRDRLH